MPMGKRTTQNKIETLQNKWNGSKEEDDPNSQLSRDIASENRQNAIYKEHPWLKYNMTCLEWYEKIIKPSQKKAA
jgi:hypothetical protein